MLPDSNGKARKIPNVGLLLPDSNRKARKNHNVRLVLAMSSHASDLARLRPPFVARRRQVQGRWGLKTTNLHPHAFLPATGRRTRRGSPEVAGCAPEVKAGVAGGGSRGEIGRTKTRNGLVQCVKFLYGVVWSSVLYQGEIFVSWSVRAALILTSFR